MKNNFCEVDSVRVSEDSIPEMLATHTHIRFGGNVVSSFTKWVLGTSCFGLSAR